MNYYTPINLIDGVQTKEWDVNKILKKLSNAPGRGSSFWSNNMKKQKAKEDIVNQIAEFPANPWPKGTFFA